MNEIKQLPILMAKVVHPIGAWIVMALGAVADTIWPTDAMKTAAMWLVVFFVCDWVTGVIAAGLRKELSSSGAKRALVKLVGYLIYMVVAAGAPALVKLLFDVDVVAQWVAEYQTVPLSAVMAGIAYTELVSIFENLKKMDVAIDARFLWWVRPVLDRIKGPEPQNEDTK